MKTCSVVCFRSAMVIVASVLAVGCAAASADGEDVDDVAGANTVSARKQKSAAIKAALGGGTITLQRDQKFPHGPISFVGYTPDERKRQIGCWFQHRGNYSRASEPYLPKDNKYTVRNEEPTYGIDPEDDSFVWMLALDNAYNAEGAVGPADVALRCTGPGEYPAATTLETLLTAKLAFAPQP